MNNIKWYASKNTSHIKDDKIDGVVVASECVGPFVISGEQILDMHTKGFPNRNYYLRRDIACLSEQDKDGTWVISENIFNNYGDGESFSDALDDFILSFEEYVELLEDSYTKTGEEATLRLLEIIQRFMVYVDPGKPFALYPKYHGLHVLSCRSSEFYLDK